MEHAIRLARYSLLLGLLILALKSGAYRLTGSVALYSDALENIINVVASGAALFALSVARRPADADHPYGHAKAEYFSAVLEGVLVLVAALSILSSAYHALQAPEPLEALGPGLLVSLGATLLNAGYGSYLIRTGRRLRSPALVADGQHLMTDVVTSSGVLLALGLVALTGWTILDPVMAMLAALNILRVGGRLVNASLRSLLDEAAPPETQAPIRRLVAEPARGALEAHDLRTRRAGRLTFIDFHPVVPEHLTVGRRTPSVTAWRRSSPGRCRTARSPFTSSRRALPSTGGDRPVKGLAGRSFQGARGEFRWGPLRPAPGVLAGACWPARSPLTSRVAGPPAAGAAVARGDAKFTPAVLDADAGVRRRVLRAAPALVAVQSGADAGAGRGRAVRPAGGAARGLLGGYGRADAPPAGPLHALGLPFVWALLDFARSLGPFGFTWGSLGYAFAQTPLVQVADLGGIALVGLLVTLTAAALASGRPAALTASLALLLLAGGTG